MDPTEKRSWTVGELAGAAGVTVRTLHHYDQVGLLTASARTSAGHRRYSERDVARLYRVLALRGLGLALADIPALLDADGLAPLLATAQMQRARVEQQLTNHERLRSRLDEVIHHLEHDRIPPTDDLFDTLETMAMTVHLTRIYTRLGDDSQTHLADLSRVAKTHPRIEAVGAVDELNAALGVASATPGTHTDGLAGWLQQIQNDLFDLGADLSHPAASAGDKAPKTTVDEQYVIWLEGLCDRVNAGLPELRSFVLPRGTLLAAQLHTCRTVCRRAERRALAVPAVNPYVTSYLNRLSDLLFILSRAANSSSEEPLWQPGRRPA